MAHRWKLSDRSTESFLQWVYLAAKQFRIPSTWLQNLSQIAPKRIVVSIRQAGIPCRFAVYPRQGGELSLLINHERQAKRLLRQLVRTGDTALDIGAHFGVYSVLLGKMVGPKGTVHAFDPHPINRQRLCENLGLNGLDWVRVQPEAISHRTGTINFNYGNSSTVSSLKALRWQRDDWHEVPTTTVDAYMEQIGWPRVSLVKIDVEGAEDLVLQGMTNTLERSAPAVLLEFHVHALSDDQALVLFDRLIQGHTYEAEVVYLRRRGSWREDKVPPVVQVENSKSLLEIVSHSDNAGILFSHPHRLGTVGRTRKGS